MDPLEALEHLSYILECDAENVTSEAKLETGQLIRLLEEGGTLEPALQAEFLRHLRDAASEFAQGGERSKEKAAICHARANRLLWKWVLANREWL